MFRGPGVFYSYRVWVWGPGPYLELEYSLVGCFLVYCAYLCALYVNLAGVCRSSTSDMSLSAPSLASLSLSTFPSVPSLNRSAF